jgi:hypothetical protein
VITHELEVNYQSRTYEDLSNEFQNLYPNAIRAFQLIPAMYNRLTLVDNLSHKAALTKIQNDHKQLNGFSTRNMYRYLPSDNPYIHKRVMTPRHKISNTKTDATIQFSKVEQPARMVDVIVERQNEKDGKDKRIQELENELKQHYHDLKDKKSQYAGLLAQVEFLHKQLQSSNKQNKMNEHSSNDKVIDFEFRLSWERVREYMSLTFKSGKVLEVWFHGRFNKLTGKVVEANLGKKSES